jgi:hypothetical protein
MGNNGKVVTAWIIAVLFLSLFVGTIIYYNNQTAKLNGKISILKSEIVNLTTANLVTALGVTEVLGNSSHNIIVQLYNHLYISGQVNNTGKGTAYNSGLRIVAYDVQGTLEVNITVPFGFRVFGTTTRLRLKLYWLVTTDRWSLDSHIVGNQLALIRLFITKAMLLIGL